MLVSPEGVVDIFWIDWREISAIHEIATMGHAGHMPKTFHRRRLATGWTEEEKVQERGAFDVEKISAVRESGGLLHLFWTQESNWPGGKAACRLFG